MVQPVDPRTRTRGSLRLLTAAALTSRASVDAAARNRRRGPDRRRPGRAGAQEGRLRPRATCSWSLPPRGRGPFLERAPLEHLHPRKSRGRPDRLGEGGASPTVLEQLQPVGRRLADGERPLDEASRSATSLEANQRPRRPGAPRHRARVADRTNAGRERPDVPRFRGHRGPSRRGRARDDRHLQASRNSHGRHHGGPAPYGGSHQLAELGALEEGDRAVDGRELRAD